MFTVRYVPTVSRNILILLIFNLSSCTYFSPSISLLRTKDVEVCNVYNGAYSTEYTDKNGKLVKIIPDTNCKMQSLYKASESLSSSIDQIEKKRNWSLSTNRTLGAATFGLGVIAVGHGIHSGHANAIKNASLGAGITYMSSTLFTPITQTQIYQAGLTSLTCVQNKAADSLALTVSADRELTDFDRISNTNCSEFNTAIEKVELVRQYAFSNDAILGSSVTNTANSIVNEVNKQIINDTPNAAAFYEAARTVGQLPPFVVPKSTNITPSNLPNGKSKVWGFQQADTCDAYDVARIAQLKIIEDRFTQAVNSMDKLGEKCTISQNPTETLTVGEEEFIVTPSLDIYQINVTGGKKPYSRTLSNQIVGLNIQMGTDTLIIAKGENLAKTGKTKVTIRDSSLIPQTKVISIEIEDSGGAGQSEAEPEPDPDAAELINQEKLKSRKSKKHKQAATKRNPTN